MLSQLIKSYDETAKSQDAMAKSLEKALIESNRAWETKRSDLVDRMSTVGRSLQGSPSTGSDPTWRSLAPPGHALMARSPYPLPWTTPSSLALERSKTAKSSNLPLPTAVPLRRSLRLEMKRNPSLYRTDSRFIH